MSRATPSLPQMSRPHFVFTPVFTNAFVIRMLIRHYKRDMLITFNLSFTKTGLLLDVGVGLNGGTDQRYQG